QPAPLRQRRAGLHRPGYPRRSPRGARAPPPTTPGSSPAPFVRACAARGARGVGRDRHRMLRRGRSPEGFLRPVAVAVLVQLQLDLLHRAAREASDGRDRRGGLAAPLPGGAEDAHVAGGDEELSREQEPLLVELAALLPVGEGGRRTPEDA